MRFFLCCFTSFLLAYGCYAQTIVLPNQGEREISNGFLFLADSAGRFQPRELLDSIVANQFQVVDSVTWDPATKVYWLRFRVQNETDVDLEWVLDFENWSLVDFYHLENGAWQQKKTGHLYPFRLRDYPVANKNYVLLRVKSGLEKPCLVRLEPRYNNEKVPQNLNFKVATKAWVDENDAQAGKIIAAFLGIFAVMFFYNLFLFFSTRLKSYGYYLLVLFFAFYHTSYNSGYLISIFGRFDRFPLLLTWFETLSSTLFIVCITLFVQEFLQIKRRYPVWNKAINISLILYVVFGILLFLSPAAGTTLTALTGLCSIIAFIVLGIKSVRDRYPSAGYFLAGYSAFLLGILIVIYLVVTNTLTSHPYLLYYSFPTGTTIEVVLFSFALANMINVLRSENEEKQRRIIAQLQENQELQTKVNRELEEKVQERTAKISAQKEQISQQKEAIEMEKGKADRLLLNILPESTANELKEKGFATPKLYQHVSVLFTDFVAFTQISERLSPEALIAELDHCFQAFDDIITRHNLEKIKTIGDAYMAAAGVPEPDEHSAHNAVRAALEIEEFMHIWNQEKHAAGESPWSLRLGIHTGPVVAGVVGKKKFAFDIWQPHRERLHLAARRVRGRDGEPGGHHGVARGGRKDQYFNRHF